MKVLRYASAFIFGLGFGSLIVDGSIALALCLVAIYMRVMSLSEGY